MRVLLVTLFASALFGCAASSARPATHPEPVFTSSARTNAPSDARKPPCASPDNDVDDATLAAPIPVQSGLELAPGGRGPAHTRAGFDCSSRR